MRRMEKSVFENNVRHMKNYKELEEFLNEVQTFNVYGEEKTFEKKLKEAYHVIKRTSDNYRLLGKNYEEYYQKYNKLKEEIRIKLNYTH